MQLTRFFRSIISLMAVLIAATFLYACSSGPKIFVNQNPEADFANYRTYNYQEPLGTDEKAGYRSILSGYLISAVDREMQGRGFSRSDNPDLVINFFVNSKEKIRTSQTPTMGGYYGYRGGYYGAYGGYETTVTQYTEGTLNIDMVDRGTRTLVWEGVAVGRVTDEVRENLQAAANAAVGEIMAEFDHFAPGYVPPPADETGQ